MAEWGPADYDRAYLRTTDPRAQSGFNGGEARWTAARRLIADAIDRPGTFLDVGCANGLLMESVAAWSPFPVEPYGFDFAPDLVALARCRLPSWSARIWLADAATWDPAQRFDFVHARVDIGHLARAAMWGRRLIVSSDGSFRRPDSCRAEHPAAALRALGLRVDGELYRRSDNHRVEIAVAWSDAR